MKKGYVLILIITLFLLVGCTKQENEVDCSITPLHESCLNEDEPTEKTCEEDPNQEVCQTTIDCDENPEHEECVQEVVIDTCEALGEMDCMFSLAKAKSDRTYETLSTYKLLSDAQTVLKGLTDPDLVVLNQDNIVLSMKYGIVNFKTKSVYQTTNLGHVDFRYPTYLNGHYNVDGVYLDSEDLRVFGMIAGVHFEVNNSEVELIPYIHIPNSFSYYEVVNGELIHKISQDIKSVTFLSIGAIDLAPDYLNENTKYYSYDNHYFYTDIKLMVDDFNQNTYEHAVNSNNPYYNYYQYISFRTHTNYTSDELNSYLNSNVSSSSGLYNTGEDFKAAEDAVMINAAMEMSFAIHESGWGSSWISQNKNNLFGIDAYDSDPYNSARSFDTVQDCIEYHAAYLLGARYFNPTYYVSFGTNFGNKYQGMNYKYASDAYWGEKIAKHYYNLDKALGFKDRNSYMIVLVKPDALGYYSPNTESPVIYNPKTYNYKGLYIPFAVKRELTDFYSLYLPVGLNDDYEMDYNEIMKITDVFYVEKDDVIVVN